MAALRTVPKDFPPAPRLEEPRPAFVADRTSLADSILHLVHESDCAITKTKGGEPPRLPKRRGWIEDLLVRLGGLGAIALSAGAFTWLYHIVHAAPARQANPGQLLLAMVGFLGASIGSSLVLLGRHIHDCIELAERWRPRV